MTPAEAIPADAPVGLRLVEAADEARRQIERDLHDGAQQRLVAASLTLRRAAVVARDTPAEPLVAEAIDQLHQGLAELRDLARGIYPAALSDHGLAPALESLVGRAPLPVELRITAPRLGPVIETAIYYTVTEALTNVFKHAAATCATVEVEIRDGVLVAVIADDGVGGADQAGGSGLRGLADRLQALGGVVTVDSPRGRGTTVEARVPLTPKAFIRRADPLGRCVHSTIKPLCDVTHLEIEVRDDNGSDLRAATAVAAAAEPG